mmetsp:Transcript_19785/g.47491  ORF Transcript_19785/g.47491 Transcript_19785/m.47491 type:complete len:211 (-) Transcript_19785:711-1343(-)
MLLPSRLWRERVECAEAPIMPPWPAPCRLDAFFSACHSAICTLSAAALVTAVLTTNLAWNIMVRRRAVQSNPTSTAVSNPSWGSNLPDMATGAESSTVLTSPKTLTSNTALNWRGIESVAPSWSELLEPLFVSASPSSGRTKRVMTVATEMGSRLGLSRRKRSWELAMPPALRTSWDTVERRRESTSSSMVNTIFFNTVLAVEDTVSGVV